MKQLLLLVCCVFATFTLRSQEKGRVDFSGYVSDMPSVIAQRPGSDIWWENLVHNRLNFGWQAGRYWRLDAGMRNRLMMGNMVGMPGYADGIGFDRGWADLSWNIADGHDILLNTTFDRLFISFEKDKWNVKLGRQRINWGQTLVWNPNDIFNTYSYFDFDYPERPGCDALRVTYYHNETSSTEVAASADHWGKVTAAILHHWNKKGFDYQLMGGVLTQSDFVIGGAVSGDLGGVNLRGEASYFHPIEHFTDSCGTLSISLGADYIFKNSLMLQAEVLYNNVNDRFSQAGLLTLYTAPLSAKYLSICNWSLFTGASYPITPRLQGSLSGMYFIEACAIYTGFTLDWSLMENLDLSFIGQWFTTTAGSPLGDTNALLGFLRLKYSF